MDDKAGAAAENGVEPVLAGDGKTLISTRFEAMKPIAEIPAPGPLANISGQRAEIADLLGGHAFGGFSEHGVIAPNLRVVAQGVETDLAADVDATRRGRLSDRGP